MSEVRIMARLMKVKTNASTMFVAHDVETKMVYIMDNGYTNSEGADIREVEDTSSWMPFENVDDVEAWLGVDANDSEAPVIVDEIEY